MVMVQNWALKSTEQLFGVFPKTAVFARLDFLRHKV